MSKANKPINEPVNKVDPDLLASLSRQLDDALVRLAQVERALVIVNVSLAPLVRDMERRLRR